MAKSDYTQRRKHRSLGSSPRRRKWEDAYDSLPKRPLAEWGAAGAFLTSAQVDTVERANSSERVNIAKLILQRLGGAFPHKEYSGLTWLSAKRVKRMFRWGMREAVREHFFERKGRHRPSVATPLQMTVKVTPALAYELRRLANPGKQFIDVLEETYDQAGVDRLIEELEELHRLGDAMVEHSKIKLNLANLRRIRAMADGKDGYLIMKVPYARALTDRGHRPRGRRMPSGPALPRLSEDVRLRVVPRSVWFLDVKTCQPTLLEERLRRAGAPSEVISGLVRDSDQIRERQAEKWGVTAEAIKVCHIALLFGGSIDGIVLKYINEERHKRGLLELDALVDKDFSTIKAAVDDAVRILIKPNGTWVQAALAKTDEGRGGNRASIEHRALCLMLQHDEDRVLQNLQDIMELMIPVRALIYDGAAIELEPGWDSEIARRETEVQLQELTGVRLRLTIKPGGVSAPLPDMWRRQSRRQVHQPEAQAPEVPELCPDASRHVLREGLHHCEDAGPPAAVRNGRPGDHDETKQEAGATNTGTVGRAFQPGRLEGATAGTTQNLPVLIGKRSRAEGSPRGPVLALSLLKRVISCWNDLTDIERELFLTLADRAAERLDHEGA